MKRTGLPDLLESLRATSERRLSDKEEPSAGLLQRSCRLAMFVAVEAHHECDYNCCAVGRRVLGMIHCLPIIFSFRLF